MRIRKIAWQFFFACFAIVAIALWITTWYSARVYKNFYQKTVENDVSITADLLQREISRFPDDPAGYRAIDSLCKSLGRLIGMRMTVVLSSGKVIGDSQSDPDTMENHANRPEIIAALRDEKGIEERYSATLHEKLLYITVPVRSGGPTKTIVRLSVSLKSIHDHEQQFYVRVFLASMTIFVLLIFASYVLSLRISRPIREMKEGAHRFAAGNFTNKLSVPRSEELGELAQSLNVMASSLDDRIQTITRQRNELRAILTGMAEGVIAIDNEERIISMNPIAAKMLGGVDSGYQGQRLHDIVRNSSLQGFLAGVLHGNDMRQTTFVLPTAEGDLCIQASGTKLIDGTGASSGAVLVLNDITRLRRLENIRMDFIANVSHELRTPLTSIKGFVETLCNGHYQLPGEVLKFLEIIASKTDRLCSIVDDILSLSSIERDQERREIGFEDGADLKTVLDNAMQTYSGIAKGKSISLELSIDRPLRFTMNPQLIEQAVTNLIDNAIKYSEEGKTVFLSASQTDDEIIITVQDHGIGIPHEHLNRIFERFYRVDKARSRKLGGTGLGLSIVKHIVNAHGGRVTVESRPGNGSTFRIILPCASKKARNPSDGK